MRQSGLLGRLCATTRCLGTATTGTAQVSTCGPPSGPPAGSNLLFMLAELSRAGAGGPGQVPVSCDSSEQGPHLQSPLVPGPVRDQVTADTNCLQSVENYQSESSTIAVKTVLCSPQ